MAEVYCDIRLDTNTDKEFEIIKEILEHKILNQKYVFYSVYYKNEKGPPFGGFFRVILLLSV